MLWFTLRVATESCTNYFMISAEILTSLASGKAAGRFDLKIIRCMFNILGMFHSFFCCFWYLITFSGQDTRSPLLFLSPMATLKPLKTPQGMFLNFLHPAEWWRPRERCKLFHLREKGKKSESHQLLQTQHVLWLHYHIMDYWCDCHWGNCQLCLFHDGFLPDCCTW